MCTEAVGIGSLLQEVCLNAENWPITNDSIIVSEDKQVYNTMNTFLHFHDNKPFELFMVANLLNQLYW